MEFTNSCRCCLLRPPDKDMPYKSQGKTDIEMLKDCFEIHLPIVPGEEKRGICAVCAGRLRDASDFKRQVQRCQAELQRLKGNKGVKEEEASVKLELSDEDYAVEPLIMTEVKVEYKKPVKIFTKKKQSVKEEMGRDEALPASQAESGDTAGGEGRACTCDHCGQQFTKKIHLMKHIKAHKKVKFYTCEVCNNDFKRYKQLVIHKRDHKGEKPFSCEICPKRFRETSSLVVHNRVHTGEKPFGCELCKKKFTQKRCLLSHKKTHATEAKGHICSVCNKGFTQKGNLIAHLRVHTGEKPFLCKICKKQFNHQSSLSHHKRTHVLGKTGRNYKYACKHCNKNFKSLFTFNCHERIHNGDKPYTCEECNKQFGRKDHLDRHKQLHTGVKQFCCEICGKQFTERSNLNAHKVVHSGLGTRRRRRKSSRRDAALPAPSGDQASLQSNQINNMKQDVPPPPTAVQST